MTDDTPTPFIHEGTEMNTSEAAAEQLRVEGVDHVFGIIGSAFVDLSDLFPPADIEFVHNKHEQSTAHMADGYTRALCGRKPGIVLVQNGPGVTNAVTGIKAAQQNYAPLVVLSPTASTGDLGTDAYQEADTMSILESTVEWQGQVPASGRMAEYIRTAFREAHAKNGPAQVDFPRDFLYENNEFDVLPPVAYRQSNTGGAASNAVSEAAGLLAESESPAIIAGAGAIYSDGAVDAIGSLAEELNAPVATSFLHNDAFPISHRHATGPLGFQGSKASARMLSEADAYIAVGSRLAGYGLGPMWGIDWFNDDAHIVQIDNDSSQIGRTTPIDVGLVGDAATTASQLQTALADIDSDVGAPGDRVEKIESEVERWHDERRELSNTDATPINPRRALLDISETIPENTIVSLDVGNTVAMARAYFEFDHQGNYLTAGSFGGCGYAWPAAIGAQLARPEDDAIAIVGDGAWSMLMSETLTAVREEIPAVACVFNNQQWGAEKQNQQTFYSNRIIGGDIPETPDYAELARDMGAMGRRVEEPEEVIPALEEALAADEPAVLDIITDPDEMVSPFRTDALAEPRRELERYRQPGDPNYEG
jgi:sulfoacetaldehyde acetyltransferase